MSRDIDSLIADFAGVNARYYQRSFARIALSARLRPVFNWAAAAMGPLWFAARGLWSWFALFVLAESFAMAQIVRGAFSDLGADEKERVARIMQTLESRREQFAGGGENTEALARLVESLEGGVTEARAAIAAAEESAGSLLAAGIVGLLLVKGLQGVMANWLLERRFARWRSDKTVAFGLSGARAAAATVGYAAIILPTLLRFAAPGEWGHLAIFPAPPKWRAQTSGFLSDSTDALREAGEQVFDSVAFGINALLDGLEAILVSAPWPSVMIFVAFLAWQAAGARVAVFSTAGLAYLGVLGFWQQAMVTMALLGAAACVSISLGIPFGILCARRPRLFAVVRPILDFMQTMPSFVYFDTGDSLFRHRQGGRDYCHTGVWESSGHSPDSAGSAECSRAYSRGGGGVRGDAVLFAVSCGFAAGGAHHHDRRQPDHFFEFGDGGGCLADRRKGTRRSRFGGAVLCGHWRGHFGGIRHFVLRDVAGQNYSRRAPLETMYNGEMMPICLRR